MAKVKFIVDTHIFRELGQLLVGRDSTALIELIKNAYDADATKVTVHGEYLDDPKRGKIIIKDDGVGMTSQLFQDGFLRIASRLKEKGNRTSLKFKRRYIGAKGIGRLAAHKLAQQIRIYSIPWERVPGFDNRVVDASIDWKQIEAEQTLDDIENSGAIKLSMPSRPRNGKPGTTIELIGIRRAWSPKEKANFFAEVQTFSPPPLLINFPKNVADSKLLFREPKTTSTSMGQGNFKVSLTGELESGDEYWQSLVHTAHWIIEIDALSETRKVRINIVPTKTAKQEWPNAMPKIFTLAHPTPKKGPFFQARILIREGSIGKKSEKLWHGKSSGIRVFMEGFRVLPYGEPHDDWLLIDADYAKRAKTLSYLNEVNIAGDLLKQDDDEEEGLIFLRNNAYFGAVFLTLSNAPTLEMLVNREGFVPVQEYESLIHILRTAIYLSVRVRASSRIEKRIERKEVRKEKAESRRDVSKVNIHEAVDLSIKRANELAAEATNLAGMGKIKAARQHIARAGEVFREAGQLSTRLMTEPAMLRILASVGTQMAAFVHEINGLLGSAVALEGAISKIREDKKLPDNSRQKLAQLEGAIGDLRRNVERQASYLTDVVSPDARRRRSRQYFSEKFDAGCRIVEHEAERRGIIISNNIPPDLKSLPMFPAELTIIFSNLLTNAVKAAGRKGKILAKGTSNDDGATLRIENTGRTISPIRGERWFKPFESTTVQTDPVLGQGMGMGLAITRNTLEEYGATIRFVKPSRNYSTAIEIKFKG